MVTVCTKCSILMDVATVLEFFFKQNLYFQIKANG